MARLKRKSAVLETAKERLAGLNAFSTAPDFGPSLTKDAYQTRATTLETRLASYNEKLSSLDDDQNEIDDLEEELNQWNKRILSAGEAVYAPTAASMKCWAARARANAAARRAAAPRAPRAARAIRQPELDSQTQPDPLDSGATT